MLSLYAINILCMKPMYGPKIFPGSQTRINNRATEKSYAETILNLYSEAEIFLINTRNIPVKNGENPFIDSTKPAYEQSKWCRECSKLFNERQSDLDAYHYVCQRPLKDIWDGVANNVIQQHSVDQQKEFSEIPQHLWPITVLQHPIYTQLLQRFAIMGIISQKRN